MPFFVFLLPILWMLFLAALLGGGAYLVLRFVRAYERRVGGGAGGDTLAERVALLERTMERMEREVEQVAEGQRFMNQLLSARQTAQPALPSPPAPERETP